MRKQKQNRVFFSAMTKHFLEEASDFLGGERAAVSEFASSDVLALASQLGSTAVFKFRGLDADLLLGEERGDDVELGWLHGSGGKGADETTEALFWFGSLLVSEHGKGYILVGKGCLFSLSLVGSTASEESSGSNTGTNASSNCC